MHASLPSGAKLFRKRSRTSWGADTYQETVLAGQDMAGRVLLQVGAVSLALVIFLVDLLTPIEGEAAVLYMAVILLVAKTSQQDGAILAAIGCVTLTALAHLIQHGLSENGPAVLRAVVSVAAIGISTAMILRSQAAAERLAEQAELLDLTRDTILVRNRRDAVVYWNRAAEDFYGWCRNEAIGRNVHELLQTVFPMPLAAIEGELTRTGRWAGELVQTLRCGRKVTVDSRWVLQRDEFGEPETVFETNTDISERKRAHAALVESERRYRTIFDSTRVAILQEDWRDVKVALSALVDQGEDIEVYLSDHPDFVRQMRRSVRIVDVNPETLRMIGPAGKALTDLSLDDILLDTNRTFARCLVALAHGETFFEGETVVRTPQGATVPVLFGITFPKDSDPFDFVLVFAIDITERKQAHETQLVLQSELANAVRLSTLGVLTASIAHEVNQPLGAILTNGEAALRWLRRDVPDLDEVQTALRRVVASANRAGEIVTRIRTLLKKAPPALDRLDLAELIEESVLLVIRELQRHDVILRRETEPRLPAVLGDRVQLQQVLINLMVNAVQAMAETREKTRTLVVRVRRCADVAQVTVLDSGPGLEPDAIDRVFQPFFTSKRDGMGMGLAISRMAVEAHGGRLWASGHEGQGAAFHFTVPLADARSA
jgi:PAS domain S-box-containing protein